MNVNRTDHFGCGCPKTEENSYLVKGKRPTCKRCAKRRSSRQHAEKMGRVSGTRARVFCKRCTNGGCEHSGACLRPIAAEPHDHPCRCGSAWPLTWKREEAKAAKWSGRY
jgi:hypothetical protein